MSDRLVTNDMPKAATYDELRDCVLIADARLIALRAELNELREERNNLISEVFRLMKMIRAGGGRPPKKGKPTLVVIEGAARGA